MAHSLAQLYVHIIFPTKRRQPFLAGPDIRRQMHAYLATVLNAYDSPALLVGGTADHVHILCSLSKTQTIAKVVGETKRSSSKWAKTKGRHLSAFQWQDGYGAFSVSCSNVSRVRAYIGRQEEHHRRTTFQKEFRAVLRKHGIEFDELRVGLTLWTRILMEPFQGSAEGRYHPFPRVARRIGDPPRHPGLTYATPTGCPRTSLRATAALELCGPSRVREQPHSSAKDQQRMPERRSLACLPTYSRRVRV